MSIFKRTQRKYVKKAYRVRNWREYEAGLRNRGKGDSRLDGVVRVLALTARFPPPRPGRVPVHKLASGERDPDGQASKTRNQRWIDFLRSTPPVAARAPTELRTRF